MAPVNPYATPTAVPGGQASGPAPARPAPSAATGFTAGLDAPKASPRLADLITSQPAETRPAGQPEATASPASEPGVRKGFSLQQLSAYAGLVMEADNPVQPTGASQPASSPRNAPGERPLRPGSRLDVTV